MTNPVREAVRSPLRPAILAVALVGCWPTGAGAQDSQPGPDAGAWRFRGSLYGYLPSLGGSASVPADSNGNTINLDGSRILDNLKFAFMGTLDAHNGQWGAFTDFVYLDFGNTKDQSRDFTIGNIGLPAGTSAHLDWRLKGVVWTIAGQYRLVSDPELTLDALGGTRLFDVDQDLSWNISGDIGPIAPSGRSGSSSTRISLWDGIVGLKGRYAFGNDSHWYVPFYLDVGTGQSDLTWQAAAGITYAFSWGELTGMWRYLDYELKSGKTLDNINFSGPMVGVTFRW